MKTHNTPLALRLQALTENPPAGEVALFADSVTGHLSARNSAGGTKDLEAGAGAAPPIVVSPTAPSPATLPARYLWVQTGLGVSGKGVTFWVEDGVA